MGERFQKTKTTTGQKPAPEATEAKARTDRQQALLDDDILDEIDDVLEEHAEEFVKAYVQKGGQ